MDISRPLPESNPASGVQKNEQLEVEEVERMGRRRMHLR